MQPPLQSLLATGPTQRLNLFLVPLDFSRLRHLIDEARNEEAKAFLLLAQQNLIADLVTLRSIIRVSRLLVLEHRENDCVRAAGDGRANLSRLHGEGHRGRPRHGAHVRYLPVGQNEVARFHGRAQFFCRTFQIMLGLGAVREFLNLLRKQS